MSHNDWEIRTPGSEHFSNGGDGVTNFSPDHLRVYEEALQRHGDDDLYIGKGWFGYQHALHCKRRKDLGAFWRVFDQVKAEMEQSATKSTASVKP